MKKYIAILFLIFPFLNIISQEKEKEVDLILDELFNENQILDDMIASFSNFQFLYFSANFNSNTYFSGRDIGIDQFNVSPQITYINSNGIFVGLSGVYYSEFIPNWDVTIATLGFGKNFGKDKKFNYSISYAKYFYANDDSSIYSNTLTGLFGIQNKNRTLGTKFTTSLLFGDDTSFEISSRSYVAFNLYNDTKTRLKFKPQLNIIAGKQTLELARILEQNGELITDYEINTVFDLINTQLNFPLILSTNSFDFELGYSVNFPNALGDESNLKSTGFLNFSIGYLLNL
jgi:hypothetical protein